MRIPLLPAAFFLVSLAAASLRAELKFEAPEIVLTPKLGEKNLAAEFKFTNTGTAPVTISRVHSGCGCTVPEKPPAPIAAGASGVIPVSYHPGEHQGRQVQLIEIETADGQVQELRLVVDLPTRVAFAPRLLLFRGPDSEPKSATITYGEGAVKEFMGVSVQSPAFELVGEPKLEAGVVKVTLRHIGPAEADSRASVRIRTRDSAGDEHVDILYVRHSP